MYCDLAKEISPSVHLWHDVDYYDNDDDEEDNRRKENFAVKKINFLH